MELSHRQEPPGQGQAGERLSPELSPALPGPAQLRSKSLCQSISLWDIQFFPAHTSLLAAGSHQSGGSPWGDAVPVLPCLWWHLGVPSPPPLPSPRCGPSGGSSAFLSCDSPRIYTLQGGIGKLRGSRGPPAQLSSAQPCPAGTGGSGGSRAGDSLTHTHSLTHSQVGTAGSLQDGTCPTRRAAATAATAVPWPRGAQGAPRGGRVLQAPRRAQGCRWGGLCDNHNRGF